MSIITIYDERVTRYEKNISDLKDSFSELTVCVNGKNDNVKDASTKINKHCTPSRKPTQADKIEQNDPVILVVPKQKRHK